MPLFSLRGPRRAPAPPADAAASPDPVETTPKPKPVGIPRVQPRSAPPALRPLFGPKT